MLNSAARDTEMINFFLPSSSLRSWLNNQSFFSLNFLGGAGEGETDWLGKVHPECFKSTEDIFCHNPTRTVSKEVLSRDFCWFQPFWRFPEQCSCLACLDFIYWLKDQSLWNSFAIGKKPHPYLWLERLGRALSIADIMVPLGNHNLHIVPSCESCSCSLQLLVSFCYWKKN